MAARACRAFEQTPAMKPLERIRRTLARQPIDRLCVNAAAAGGGYILGTGCEVPPGTPLENLQTLVRVAHEYRGSHLSAEAGP
jgi:uroporphyrinogen-III decarboxylase